MLTDKVSYVNFNTNGMTVTPLDDLDFAPDVSNPIIRVITFWDPVSTARWGIVVTREDGSWKTYTRSSDRYGMTDIGGLVQAIPFQQSETSCVITQHENSESSSTTTPIESSSTTTPIETSSTTTPIETSSTTTPN